MKLNDAIIGGFLATLAGLLLWHLRDFPEMPGQHYGAAAFPRLIGFGLAACAAILLVRGLRQRIAGGSWIGLAAWTRSPRTWLDVAIVPIVLLLYIVGADRIGFLLLGTFILLALFLTWGVRALPALLLAPALTLAIHYAFYKLLRVPLPWGMLERLAW